MVQDYFPAGCFGKLPIYGDFIRHGAAGREIVELDDWIQRGIEICQRRGAHGWEEDFNQAPAQCFLFHGIDPRRFLTGIMQPSSDENGRNYPFIFFWVVDRSLFGNNLTIAPVIFRSVMATASDWAAKAANGLVTLKEIRSSIDIAGFSVSAGWEAQILMQKRWLEETTLLALLSALGYEFDDERKYYLFGNLAEIALRLRGHAPSQWQRGLGFPLAGGHEFRSHVSSFWLQIIWRVLHRPVAAPAFFWPAVGMTHQQRMWIFFRRPSEEFLLPIISASYSSDRLDYLDLRNQRIDRKAEDHIPLPYRLMLQQSLNDNTITLVDFLQKF